MILLVIAIGLIVACGLLALFFERRERLATAFALAGCLSGCLIAAVPAVRVLATGRSVALRLPWSIPMGSFAIALDPLSAFFCLPIVLLGGLAAIYGTAYLRAWRGRKNLGACWFFFNVLLASMLLVVSARNGVLFLIAWEVMALASFFLVMFEDEKESVRRAGRTYLIATHLGTASLLVLFLLLGRRSASLDFDAFGAASSGVASAVFLLALVGFGTKAGLMPLHVWLPEAHPAAPSHVSALMSGVMIKTGIYGLLRTFTFLGPPPAWWGWTIVCIAVVSGVLGVLFALAQHDLKRLLAYHSVENIGIICLGLGIGLLGESYGQPAISFLGFAGGLLHVFNHALFKGLLFLGAGAVVHSTHTREIDHLGGLLKRMPWTGALFLIGAAAICGLPPLNGFTSEFLIYVGAFNAVITQGAGGAIAGIVVIGALALIGGLAVACFAKAFGIVFLGEARSDHATHAMECGWAMRLPMAVLAAGCVLGGLLGPVAVHGISKAAAQLCTSPGAEEAALTRAVGPLRWVMFVSAAFLLLAAAVAYLRHLLLNGRSVRTSVTWDCGYAAPAPRMQYTSSGFAQPIVTLFRFVLRTHREQTAVAGYFPGQAGLSTHTNDPAQEEVYEPAFEGAGRLLAKLRWLQSGHMQLYVLYIAVTLLVLLVWKLG